MRGDVLVVVIGVLCWHPGSTACWRDNKPLGGRVGGERESDHPTFNTIWPGLHPACGQLKSEPVMHICALFYCCSNFVMVCTEGNKQSTVSPCSHITDWNFPPPSSRLPPPPIWKPIWTHVAMHWGECKVTDLILKQHSTGAPMGYMTGFYLKEKRQAGGDFKSEEDIRKIHWKKSPLAIFFSLSGTICTFPSEGKVCSHERGREEGMDTVFLFLFFWVGLKCRRCNENQLAGRHYLSVLVKECIDLERKNRPSLIQSGLHVSFSSLDSLFSFYFIFNIENGAHVFIFAKQENVLEEEEGDSFSWNELICNSLRLYIFMSASTKLDSLFFQT